MSLQYERHFAKCGLEGKCSASPPLLITSPSAWFTYLAFPFDAGTVPKGTGYLTVGILCLVTIPVLLTWDGLQVEEVAPLPPAEEVVHPCKAYLEPALANWTAAVAKSVQAAFNEEANTVVGGAEN